MAYFSRNEFVQMQEVAQQRAANYDPNRKFVGFFKLVDDGDEAVVRFPYKDPSEFEIYTVHGLNNVYGRGYANINCINDLKTVTNCPLCKAGKPLRQRLYLKLIEYVRDDEGNIVPTAKIWDMSARGFLPTMTNLIMEYGDLSKCLFKIKRNGVRKDPKTTYTIMYAPPAVYTDDKYPEDFSAFEGYNVLGNAILDKTYDQLVELVNELDKPEEGSDEQPTVSAPSTATFTTYSTAPQFAASVPPVTPQPGPRRAQY